MDNRHADTFITDNDWIRLREWSQGYDDGWSGTQVSANPIVFHGSQYYAAGFIRGQRDRLEFEQEHAY